MTENERHLLYKNGPEKMRTTVWFSDFQDFPGLASTIFTAISIKVAKVIEVARNFVILEHSPLAYPYISRWIYGVEQ